MAENVAWDFHVRVISQMDDLCSIPATPSRARVNIRRKGFERRVSEWLMAGGIEGSSPWVDLIVARDRLARALAADQPADMFRFWMRWDW